MTLAVALSLVSVFACADEQSRTTAPFKSIDLAAVKGMGELVYYGKPRTLNKTVAGIGSVKAGD